MHVVDLDSYRAGPFTNEMGRLFVSTRFMAPEEHTLGARIDERTTVFTMGRVVDQFLSADAPNVTGVTALVARACDPDARRRFASMAEFYDAWSACR